MRCLKVTLNGGRFNRAYVLPSKHITSLQRRCNVTTLQRSCNEAVATVCVCRVGSVRSFTVPPFALSYPLIGGTDTCVSKYDSVLTRKSRKPTEQVELKEQGKPS